MFLKQRQRSRPDCINFAVNLFWNCGVKFVIETSQQTCFASGLVDYALLLCRTFAAKLPHQVCHDKLISKKVTLAANVHAIWMDAEQYLKYGRLSSPCELVHLL
ncbi:hypothetical protein AVEN_212094-1 [Araneus ventricosus]|uniref:Uncharacterized protein n=1 Tax=Araneus ventricosus TaxID=182803 RepID=A0A4Y2PPA2_ARAVE|nr:hypothetical protein AVEN_212094-1 [Araneus ventricosus]